MLDYPDEVEVTDLHRERRLKVADAIEREPEHFDMSTWFWRRYENDGVHPSLGLVPDLLALDLRSCGTTACVAGWACSLYGADALDLHETHRRENPSIGHVAAEILGLTYEQTSGGAGMRPHFEPYVGEAERTNQAEWEAGSLALESSPDWRTGLFHLDINASEAAAILRNLP